jgi:hypothetical protein
MPAANGKARKIIAWLCKIPALVTATLDWLVGTAERLIVLAIAFGIFFVGWKTLFGADESPFLKSLSDSWKGLLLLLVPLLYRPVRTFLERVEEAWGMKARPSAKSGDPEKPGAGGE